MAAAVKAAFTVTEEEALGNVIYNGYIDIVPNTINKKAWQYKETNTAPVDLPSLSVWHPALKGWTTNYMQYYTRLGPVPVYGTTSGDPTMFDYAVHSFTAQQGAVLTLTSFQAGQGYTPGSYVNVATFGGSGTGATLNITVDINGVVTLVALNSAGNGYTAGDGLGVVSPGPIGSGYGFAVTVATVSNVSPAGQPKWNQVPHRYFQNQVGTTGPNPSVNYDTAIQYSFIYPIADRVDEPPIDIL
jgi:hypothetical protein